MEWFNVTHTNNIGWTSARDFEVTKVLPAKKLTSWKARISGKRSHSNVATVTKIQGNLKFFPGIPFL